MKTIDQVSKSDLAGKRVLVRAGLDASLEGGKVVSDVYRLHRALPTLEYVRSAGAKTIVIAHIGRHGDSLEPVAQELKRMIPLTFVRSIFSVEAQAAVSIMKDGDVLMFENLRTDPREEENDPAFARALASLADIYVDDAFSNAHRAHASMVGIPAFLPAYGGLLMKEEIDALTPARTPPHPALAIIGGAKFETKAPLIRNLLDVYDRVFVCGALVNDVLKARGYEVGRSLISEFSPPHEVIEHPKLILPIDVTVEREDGQARVKKPDDVEVTDRIVDMGPDSYSALVPILTEAKMVLWNGPTGVYEDGYLSWTHAIAEQIAESGARSIIGGNNTLAAIKTSGVAEEKFGFLSTGGGAMLEFLLRGTLPAIEALH